MGGNVKSSRRLLGGLVLGLLLLGAGAGGQSSTTPLSLDQWHYLSVDANRERFSEAQPYLGLAFGDINRDGFADIVSGKYFYRSPGGDLSGAWTRIAFPQNLDASLVADVDQNGRLDVIAQALPQVYWLEADTQGNNWTVHEVATLEPTLQGNSQGYVAAQIIPQNAPEFVFTTGKGIWYLRVPPDNVNEWLSVQITDEPVVDGVLAASDMDADGDADVVGALDSTGRDIVWWENPNPFPKAWEKHVVGSSVSRAGRAAIGDINGDRKPDVIIADANDKGDGSGLFWFANPADDKKAWPRRTAAVQGSLRSLSVADLDKDGDTDIVTGEQKGAQRLVIWENQNKGAKWVSHVVDRGKESYLGARLTDLDGDGDLEIVSITGDNSRFLHAWGNDARDARALRWRLLSSENGELPVPGESTKQTTAMILDVDKDGANDFVIGLNSEGGPGPAVVWFRRDPLDPKGWVRSVIEPESLPIEAGGTYADVDSDGDSDVVMAEDSNGNHIYWWENPYPNLEPSTPWKRHVIKDAGYSLHHDLMFGEFDGDPGLEFVFWNQGIGRLYIADVPPDPQNNPPWQFREVFATPTHNIEGLAKADIDGDGLSDIVAGGRWFKLEKDGKFGARVIDAEQEFSRAAVGQLKKGGRPEVVFVPGDAAGPLEWYEWDGKAWVGRKLLPIDVQRGHSLELADFNGDSNLDIFVAEMRVDGTNPNSKMIIFFGDGRGGFARNDIASGYDNHESKVGDLDGDGDMDILGKPYNFRTPALNVWFNNLKR
jgi:hypothetical protein